MNASAVIPPWGPAAERSLRRRAARRPGRLDPLTPALERTIE